MRAVHMSPGLYSSLRELVISVEPDFFIYLFIYFPVRSLFLWIFLDLVCTFFSVCLRKSNGGHQSFHFWI